MFAGHVDMAHQFDHQSIKTRGMPCGFLAAVALAALWTLPSRPAEADEVEDMLVRLAAAAARQSDSASVTNVIGANGVIGAIVSGSGNGSQGIMALNQDAGPRGATQANIVIVALSTGLNSAALARLLAEQVHTNDEPLPDSLAVGTSDLAALAIVDSYRNGTGVAQINQSAGEGNVQRNAALIAVALGGGDALAISEADLSATSATSVGPGATGGQRGIASVRGSFTDFSGVAQVNQTIGTGNIVSNTISFTFAGAQVGGG
jgi:hypothetical protein